MSVVLGDNLLCALYKMDPITTLNKGAFNAVSSRIKV